jgi:hypothetical protein
MFSLKLYMLPNLSSHIIGCDSTSVVGDDSHDNGGRNGGCGCGFRHGGEFGGELWFDAT